MRIGKISTPNIVYKMQKYTFCFSNVLMIGLCSSGANSCVSKSKGRWFDIYSFLTAPQEGFSIKKFINY